MARVEASPAEIEALIDDLQTVGEPGIGYETTSTASDFLPLPGAMNWHAGLLYQNRPPVRSDVLAKLVACGAPAVTHLVAHLDDARPASVTIEGPGWRYLGDEYDVNIRTDLPPGEGLNDWPSNLPAPDETITVGDLCFVALGQIVNRQFNAVRYQPTMNIIINSPRQSPPSACGRSQAVDGPDAGDAPGIADRRLPPAGRQLPPRGGVSAAGLLLSRGSRGAGSGVSGRADLRPHHDLRLPDWRALSNGRCRRTAASLRCVPFGARGGSRRRDQGDALRTSG
jgi:hypothetical protein